MGCMTRLVPNCLVLLERLVRASCYQGSKQNPGVSCKFYMEYETRKARMEPER